MKSFNPISESTIYSTAIQSDGKIIAAGYAWRGSTFDIAVVRYNNDGSLDYTFGTNGVVITKIGSSTSYAYSVAIQDDGKIVAAGDSYSFGNLDFITIRYNQDGVIDTSFGTNGIVATPIGAFGDNARSVLIQKNGKIVTIGYYYDGTYENIALVRYNNDGSLDNNFGTNGIVTTSIGSSHDVANTAVIQSDGKVVIGGYSSNGTNKDFALVRYKKNGDLDSTFGTNGIVITSLGSFDSEIESMGIQSDGKILAAGYNLSMGYSLSMARYKSDGSLDSTFGINGIVNNQIGTDYLEGNSVLIQSDGKIIATGYASFSLTGKDFVAARFNQGGSIDSAFGKNGFINVDLGYSYDLVHTASLQSDGRIIEGGSTGSGQYYYAMSGYNNNGTLDETFGDNGIVVSQVGNSKDNALSSIIQDDGKIVIAGYASIYNDTDFAVIRFNIDGKADTTFGTEGVATAAISSFTDGIFSVAKQNDGKIVAGGFSNNGTDDDFALTRFNVDGSLDNTFGINGIITTPIGASNDRVRSVLIQPDGKIIAAGFSSNILNNNFALVRYNTNGNIDNTFGTNGIVTTQIGPSDDIATSEALQNDGKIILAGYLRNGSNDDFALVRYKADGNPDSTFGSNGVVITPIGIGEDKARSVLIQNDGKIIAAGISGNGSNFDFALVRYDQGGTKDTSFGADGITTTSIGTSGDLAYSSVIQSDGKILVAGTSKIGSYNDIAVVRYKSDGTIDTSFGTNGIAATQIGVSFSYAHSIALQDDGNIVVSGYSTDGDNYSVFTVVRYLNDVAMPVELTSLTAQEINNGVTLNWTTATEINNLGYEVQRKEKDNKSDWKRIGFVNGHGNSTVINHYKYLDKEILNSNRVYRLKQIDFDENYEYSPEVSVTVSAPTKFELFQNYPNPFNPTTKIKYSIPTSPQTPLLAKEGGRGEAVTLKIYDILGSEVATLVNEKKQPGTYEVTFNGSKLSSGVYFYQLKSSLYTQTKKMIVIK